MTQSPPLMNPMKTLLSAILLSTAVALLALSGCKSQPEPTDDGAKPDNEAATASAQNTADVDTAFHLAVDTYAVTLSHTTDDARELFVVPKGIYHINLEYPWKFVDNQKKTLKRDAFDLKESRATLALPAETLEGTLSFSVCSAQTCLLEKVVVKGTLSSK